MKDNLKFFFLLFYPVIDFIFGKRIRKETYLQLAKYGFVGVIGNVTNYIIFIFFKYFVCSTIMSNAISMIITLIETFLLQKYITFKTKKKYFIEFCLFLGLALVRYVIDTSILIVLIDWLCISSFISKAISLIVFIPISFVSQKFIVFKERLD